MAAADRPAQNVILVRGPLEIPAPDPFVIYHFQYGATANQGLWFHDGTAWQKITSSAQTPEPPPAPP